MKPLRHVSLLALVALAADASAQQRYYVDIDAPSPNNNGLSWGTSFKYLRDGLDAARTWLQQNNGPVEVWVAAGTYRPDMDVGNPNGNNARDRSFELQDDVLIYGGFVGNEALLEDRPLLDPAHASILTGEVGGSGLEDNCYHVVDGSFASGSVGERARLDGFTITRGSANNTSSTSSRSRGGGFYAGFGVHDVVNCRFEDNHAHWNGGGAAVFDGALTVFANCWFEGNTASYGGGLAVVEGRCETQQCVLVGNEASVRGGAMVTGPQANLSFHSHATITGNSAPFGGGVFVDSGTTTELVNSIVWNNAAPSASVAFVSTAALLRLRNSTYEGAPGDIVVPGPTGLLEINSHHTSPAFTDPLNGDYTPALNSVASYGGDTAYLPIDLGDLDRDGDRLEHLPLDLGLGDRVIGASVGMGAYEPRGEGSSYCVTSPNSASAAGAHVFGYGSTTSSDQDVTLRAIGTPDAAGIFFFGPTPAQNPVGQGFVCVGGAALRLPVEFATGGVLEHTLDFGTTTVSSNIVPGTSWRFQAWFRDSQNGVATFNFSDGALLQFQ